MKHLLHSLFISVTCFCCALTLPLSAATAPTHATVSIATDEASPFNAMSWTGKPGYLVELSGFILGQHGHRLDYQLLPHSQTITAATSGEADCLLTTRPAATPDMTVSGNPWGISANGFYSHQNSRYKAADRYAFHQFSDREQLATQLTATLQPHAQASARSYPDRLWQADSEQALDDGLRALLDGRIDILMTAQPMMAPVLAAFQLESVIRQVWQSQQTEPLWLACRADESGQHYAALLSEGMKKLQANGELTALLADYHLPDWHLSDRYLTK